MCTVARASRRASSRPIVADAEAILALQKLAYASEARLYDDWSIPPLTQSLTSLIAEFDASLVMKAMLENRLVGSVRAKVVGTTCQLARLVVDPVHQGQGIGSRLLREAEALHPTVARYELFTGSRSDARCEYSAVPEARLRHQRPARSVADGGTLVYLEKAARAVNIGRDRRG